MVSFMECFNICKSFECRCHLRRQSHVDDLGILQGVLGHRLNLVQFVRNILIEQGLHARFGPNQEQRY